MAFDDGDDLSPRRSGWGVGAWGWMGRPAVWADDLIDRGAKTVDGDPVDGRDVGKLRGCASQPVRSEMLDNWSGREVGARRRDWGRKGRITLRSSALPLRVALF